MRLFLVAAAITLAAAASVAHAAPCRLADLRWMAGAWRYDTAGAKSEERWIVGPGDRLMGSSWELHIDRPGGVVEAETIQADAAGQILLRIRHFAADLGQAWEDKTTPMAFAAAGCAADTVVFDGQADHAGEHITYRRSGDTLTFTGDFLHQGLPVQVVIRFARRGE